VSSTSRSLLDRLSFRCREFAHNSYRMNDYNDTMIEQLFDNVSRNLVQLCWEYVPRPVQGPQEKHVSMCIDLLSKKLPTRFVFKHRPLTMNNEGNERDYNTSMGWRCVSGTSTHHERPNRFIVNELLKHLFSWNKIKHQPYLNCILVSWPHTQPGLPLYHRWRLWMFLYDTSHFLLDD
jgi:hypothetical protein